MTINKFTLGAIAGIATVALAVPLLAQISSAETTGGITVGKPAPTQQQVKDMAANDAAFLTNIDAFVTVQKSAVQAHEAALTAAAAVTDDTQRHTAVKKAHDDLRSAMQAALTANPDLKSAMMPFGKGRNFGGGKGGPGMMGRGPDQAALAAKFGMTEAELKAALDAGKTIPELATEKGITLPVGNGRGGKRGWMMGGPKGSSATTGSTSSAQ